MNKVRKMIKVGFVMNALLLGSAFSAKAAEPEVVITDDLAPHTPVTQTIQFATTLSASVKNPPKSNEETTVTGPTWKWSITSQTKTALFLPSDTGSNVGLQSHLPPRYQMEGNYSATVQAIATFKRKLNAAPHTETSIPVIGSIGVKFFVRVPKTVYQNGNPKEEILQGSPMPEHLKAAYANNPEINVEGFFWGHISTYNLQLRDNQTTPQLYGFGVVKESFENLDPPNMQMNLPSTWSAPMWPDNIATFIPRDPIDLGVVLQPDDFMYSLTQQFYHQEDEPPFNVPYPSIIGTTLNAHGIDNRYRFTLRDAPRWDAPN